KVSRRTRMNRPSFVYVTYIATTPEKVWNALTDGEITKQYWGRRVNVSDWYVGSAWQHRDCDDPELVDIIGTVIESTPPQRLVVPGAGPADAATPGKHSRVTFEIAPVADSVRLTVTHDELEPGSDMARDIARGWPAVLSSLKTLLETGRPLPFATRRTG